MFVVLFNVQLLVLLKSRNSWKGIREYIYNDDITEEQRDLGKAEFEVITAASAATTTTTTTTASRAAYERHLQRRNTTSMENPNRIPDNLHAHYPLQCRENTENNTWEVPAALSHGPPKGRKRAHPLFGPSDLSGP